MSVCYGCCVACKPRYKILVDNIFPVSPQDGLVKNNMEKLTFYALSSPEKLDRIGDYLAKRLSHDVHRHKLPFVVIAMEALDQLLVACHSQTLNLFVESFLRMVQKLLECDEPDLQCMATSSFVKFSNIEEDTPSYHRRYDFFVSKFSAMCHCNFDKEEDRTRVRVAGLRGLQGVVRKTVSDDLQVNIWEHMDKIVPSLLYNIQSHSQDVAESPREEYHPSVVAENCFRDLICRASFGNIKSILQPALRHLDNHGLWVPTDFAVKCFKMIMYSVQAQFGYLVVQTLMSHLDGHSKSEAKVKASIVDVLGETVLIAAGGSIGPSVLEVFNTLLRHLKNSVNSMPTDERSLSDEKRFQESIINTIGEFANNLPDYQKIEILMFVMGKVPMPSEDNLSDSSDVSLQTMLLKTLLKVAIKYKTMVYSNAFPPSLLEPLLRISIVNDSGIRLIVQKILQKLLDRHDNSGVIQQVRIPKDIAQLDLTVELPPRQDIMFLKKQGIQFYWHLFENMQIFNNKSENFEALYCTLALLSIECGGEEIHVDLIRLALGIQQAAQTKSDLPITHKCAMHAVVAAYLNLISQLTVIPAFCQHCAKVIQCRENEATYLLPDQAFNRTNTISSYPTSDNVKEYLLFSKNSIAEALKNAGFDTTKLDTPFAARPSGIGIDTVDRTHSVNDLHSISLEVDSIHSSPGLGGRRISLISRKYSVDLRHPEEEITFESMKKILAQSDEKLKQEEEERRLYILDTFRNAPFEEIMARSEAKNKLDDIINAISQDDRNTGAEKTPLMSKCDDGSNEPSFEMQYPDLFVY